MIPPSITHPLREILRLQWTSYWRRISRGGNGAKNNLIVLCLISLGLAAKYVSILQGVVAETRRGHFFDLDLLAAGLFVLCVSSVWDSGSRGMGPRELARFPLTARERFVARMWGGFVSPLCWIAAVFCAALLWPLAVSPHPICAVLAGLAFFRASVMFGFSARHFLDTATGSKLGYAVGAILVIAGAILWIEFGRNATLALNFLPPHLLILAAQGNWLACGILIALAVAASFLARYSLTWMLEHAPATISRKTASSSTITVLGKDLRYFRRSETMLWLILAGLVFYLGTAPAPEPDAVRAVLAFTSVIAIAAAMNGFGPDGPAGLARYGLWPIRGTSIIVTKNRALATLALLRWGPVLMLSFWRFGWIEGVYDTVEGGALLLASLAWGNVASVRSPFVGDEAPSLFDQVIGLGASALPGIWTIGILRAGTATTPYIMAGMLALCAIAYTLSVTWAARYYERNFDAMQERLS